MITTSQQDRAGLLSVIADYIALTKPRVMSLLLLTATTGMFAAERGVPALSLIAYVLVGGALASGGASALNMWFEEDLDRRMGRTSNPANPRKATTSPVLISPPTSGRNSSAMSTASAKATKI